MDFRKISKTPLTPASSFRENHVANFFLRKRPKKALYKGLKTATEIFLIENDFPHLPLELCRKFICFGALTRFAWFATKCAPSTSCVPPVMTAMTERIVDQALNRPLGIINRATINIYHVWGSMYEIYHKSMSYASSGTPLLKFSHLIQTLAFRQKRDGPCPNSKLEFLKLYAVM